MFRECSLRIAAFGAFGVLLLGPVAAEAQSAVRSVRKQTTAAAKKPSLDPKAIEVLKAVRDRLAAAHTLSFVAVETVESEGPRSEVTLQRPDKLRVILSGDGPRSQSYCNGNTMLTYSPVERSLVIAKAPPTINGCLKDAYKASAIDFPLIDLIIADPFSELIPGLKRASYLGQSQVAGETNTDIVAYSSDHVSVQMWVGTQDKLPRLIHAVYLDDPNRLRRRVAFSDWKIDVPVRPEVFTSLKTGNGDDLDSEEPRPVGTSGLQPALRVRPLTLYTFGAKYWGSSAPVGVDSAYTNYYGGTAQATPYGATGYYQSPDGYTYYAPTNYAPYPGATAGYYGNDWVTEGPVDETAGGFNLSLVATTPEYNAGVPAGYNQSYQTNRTNITNAPLEPGQIVSKLPVGCAAYTRGAAFYLCGSTWFSGVYGPNGELYFRVISTPYPY